MLKEGENIHKFSKHHMRTKMPCYIVFDFEATNTPYNDLELIEEIKRYSKICEDIRTHPKKYTSKEIKEYTKYQTNTSYTEKIAHQMAYSYKWRVVTDYPVIFTPQHKLFRGKTPEETLRNFVKDLSRLEKILKLALAEVVPMKELTEDQKGKSKALILLRMV
jgi:hypothetical protein